MRREKKRKITVEVPSGLLRRASKATGLGASVSVRLGLRFLIAAYADKRARRKPH